MEVTIIDRQRSVRIGRTGLATFVRRLSRAVPPRDADALAICLVSEARMREFNRRFRGRDRVTDVLSFPAGDDPDPEGARYLGDIVIAPRVAERQARRAGHSVARETRLLALHGYLHLLGYDHETDEGAMRDLERRLVRRLLPRGATPERG